MFLEIIILLVILVGTLFYHKNKRPPNFPPVPRVSFPVLGHMPYFLKDEEKGLHKLFLDWGQELNSKIIGVDFANYRTVVINDHKLIKQAFSNPSCSGRLNGRPCSVRGGDDDGINRGIIFSEGWRWTEQRRFAVRHLKEFGFGRKSMESIILTEAEELVRDFGKDAGKPISTTTRFNAAVVNTIWQICSGERFSHDDPELKFLVKAIIQNIQGSKVLGPLLFMPWFRKLFPSWSGWNEYFENFRTMDNYIKKFVNNRVMNRKSGDKNDFTDVYLEEVQNSVGSISSFNSEEGMKNLYNTLGDIFSAGSETTSTSMSWISIYLAVHPKVQEELHSEIDRVIGLDRLPTLEDRDSMPYLEAVIQETLRMSTVVVLGISHRATEDFYIDGYFIPKDTLVAGNHYGTSHDPDVWGSDVDVFNPDRFLSPDKKKVLRNEAMIAFSAGRRICIGEALARNEIFLFTALIFQKFTVHPDPDTPLDLTPNFGGTVAGPRPHKLIFNKRL